MSLPIRLARRPLSQQWVLAGLLVMAAAAGCASRDPWEDARIESEVKARLVAQKDADLTRLSVVSRKGVVHLNGVVGSLEQKEQADALAKDVRGVSRVINSVMVRPPSPRSLAPGKRSPPV